MIYVKSLSMKSPEYGADQMPLDPTHSELNIRKSLIKYFTDSLIVEDGLLVRFSPGLKPLGEEVEWISFQFGSLNPFNGDGASFTVFCCTRNDPEGIALSALSDKLKARLTDSNAYDMRRNITLYDVSDIPDPDDPDKNLPWRVINHAKITFIADDNEYEDPDGTQYKIFSVRMWFPKR